MYFHESEAIAHDHRDLQDVVEQIDLQLATIFAPAPLRADDISCAIGCDTNQAVAVFELFAGRGVLKSEAMVECEKCQNLMSAAKFHEAFEDEDEFTCTSCGHPFRGRERPFVVYRMTSDALTRAKPTLPEAEAPFATIEEPLGNRAILVLIAMLEMGAFDSDSKRTTEEIAIKALGNSSDANSLKGVMADLSTRRLIDSKTGRGGGCWLTSAGRARAEKLRNHLSETP